MVKFPQLWPLAEVNWVHVTTGGSNWITYKDKKKKTASKVFGIFNLLGLFLLGINILIFKKIILKTALIVKDST